MCRCHCVSACVCRCVNGSRSLACLLTRVYIDDTMRSFVFNNSSFDIYPNRINKYSNVWVYACLRVNETTCVFGCVRTLCTYYDIWQIYREIPIPIGVTCVVCTFHWAIEANWPIFSRSIHLLVASINSYSLVRWFSENVRTACNSIEICTVYSLCSWLDVIYLVTISFKIFLYGARKLKKTEAALWNILLVNCVCFPLWFWGEF